MEPIDPRHREKRTGLRALGIGLLAVGGIFTAIGLVSFFSAFGDQDPGGGMPSRFWMAFIGLPMIAIGWRVLAAGYLGSASRYAAGEVAPVARDTMDYLGAGGGRSVTCRECGRDNEAGSQFCESCGTPLAVACPDCRHPNEPGSRFCESCGSAFAGPARA